MGTVSYEVHNLTNGTSLMSTVNTYINSKLSNEFRGTWMLVVEWKDIPQNGDQHSNVRRKNAAYIFFVNVTCHNNYILVNI